MHPSELVQGSPEWLAARVGKITGSRMNDVLAKLKGAGEAKTRSDYRMELVAERLTGEAAERYVNGYMEWGTEYEPLARSSYEILFDRVVTHTGLIIHPEMPFAASSPDGLVDDGLIEIKCPKTTTHLRWRMKNTVPEEHVSQVYWALACTGMEWADFVSFDPRLPESMQLFVVRLYPEKELMDRMEAEVRRFEEEIEEAIAKLKEGAYDR